MKPKAKALKKSVKFDMKKANDIESWLKGSIAAMKKNKGGLLTGKDKLN